MPDTDRYRQWVAMLSASDAVLVQLAGLALVAVFVWLRLSTMPEPWRERARLLYMSMALAFLLLQMVTTRGTLYAMLAGLGLSIVARSVWAYRRRRVAPTGPLSKLEE